MATCTNMQVPAEARGIGFHETGLTSHLNMGVCNLTGVLCNHWATSPALCVHCVATSMWGCFQNPPLYTCKRTGTEKMKACMTAYPQRKKKRWRQVSDLMGTERKTGKSLWNALASDQQAVWRLWVWMWRFSSTVPTPSRCPDPGRCPEVRREKGLVSEQWALYSLVSHGLESEWAVTRSTQVTL